jgi:hypothetical protein
MLIHIARHAAQLGTFTEAEIADGLQTGRFLLSDIAWTEGMATWVPLKVWPAFQHLTAVVPADAPHVAPSLILVMPAWERDRTWKNYFRTFWDIWFHPQNTFDHLPRDGVNRALSFYYYTIGSVLLAIGTLFFILDSLLAKFAPGWIKTPSSSLLSSFIYIFVGLSLLPVLQFLFSGLTHLLLLPWRPQGGYQATYRAMSYTTAALPPVLLIPCFNYFCFLAWLPLTVFACVSVHRLAWWKVLLSVLATGLVLLIVLFPSILGYVLGMSQG